MNDISPARVAVAAIAAVACACLFLPAAQSGFWFGGDGFGTVFAQGLYWAAYRLLGSPKAAPERSVLASQMLLAALIFSGGLGLAFMVARRLSGRGRNFLVLIATALYLSILFVFPQATFGP